MNKKSSLFYRIDDRVFFTMAALCICCLIILSFRYTSHHECLPVTIVMEKSDMLAGSTLVFKAETSAATKYSWNFGDNTTQNEESNTAIHKYKEAGHYVVRVLVNGECTGDTDVVISEKKIIRTPTGPAIKGDVTVPVNKEVIFSDTSSSSTSWRWTDENGDDVSLDKKASYRFSTPGVHKISLFINGQEDTPVPIYITVVPADDDKNKGKSNAPRKQEAPIVINANPTVPPLQVPATEVPKTNQEETPKPKARVLDKSLETSLFRSMLFEVAKGAKKADDFKDLCDPSMQVAFNGKTTTFVSMCDEIKKIGFKKIKSIDPQLIINPQANCVSGLIVTMKTKGLFERIF